MTTLDQQIMKALGGGESYEDPTITKTAAARPPADTPSDVEKIATALEFIGRRGVENLVKEASAMAPPPGTNMGQSYADHQQKTVKPHKAAPPMAPKATGEADHDLNSRPGGSGEQAKPRGDGQTHHSALGSSQAAIDFDKREKAKQVAADLGSLFDAKPFADPKVKENFTGAAGKGDKNIHVKTASDRELLRQALAKKIAEQQEA
jgi:hypothetical protein